MTWHLKDRELEKVFEAYSGGKFVKSLNYAVEQEIIDSECVVYVGFGREFLGPDFAENCLCFRTDELEEVHEYNPHSWNEFPTVKPPYDVMMRIEFENGEGTKGFYKHGFDGSDYWFSKSRMAFSKNMLINNPIKRFRPWED